MADLFRSALVVSASVVCLPTFASPTYLFDATKAQMAGNADWVVDADVHNIGTNSTTHLMVAGSGTDSNPQRVPTGSASLVNSSTAETYWAGALSSWGVGIAKNGGGVESLPYSGSITYGNVSNPQDLSNYRVFVSCEPNIMFTAAEKTALINFVKDGGGLMMVADHSGSDRNSDGNDSTDVWNDFLSNNGVANGGLGITFNANSVSVTSSQIDSTATDPITHGYAGVPTSFEYNAGTNVSIDTTKNASAKIAVWSSSSHSNTNGMVAYATYGLGRIVAVGDSSPADDGTGDSNDTLFTGWTTASDGTVFLNASDWLARSPIASWTSTGGGTWSNNANWNTFSPGGTDYAITLGKSITAAATVTLDVAKTIGSLKFDNANRYTIAGSSTLTFAVTTGSSTIDLVSGSHTISAPVVFANAAIINVTPASSVLTLSGDVTGGNVSLTKTGSGTLEMKNVRSGTLNVSAGAVRVLANGTSTGVSALKALTLAGSTGAWTTRLDLNDNDLIVDYTGATVRGTIEDQVKQGFANGAWNGSGITSTIAATTLQRALGVAEASDLFTTFPATFMGQSVDATSVIIRYTAPGDLNLDGTVNSLDFTKFVASFGSSTGRWALGDFNYDGKVNTIDFNQLAGNFGQTVASPTLGSIVPEPVCAIGLLGLLGVRRRR